MDFQIANYKNWEAIARLHAQSWQQHYRGSFSDHYLDHEVIADRQTVWKERLKSPPSNQYAVLAREGEQLLGFVCVYLNEDPKWGAFLDNIHVDQKFAGKGIGKILMQKAAAAVLEQSESKAMYLWVLEDNIAARRFYERLGGAPQDPVSMETPGDGGQAMVIRFYWEDAGVI